MKDELQGLRSQDTKSTYISIDAFILTILSTFSLYIHM